MSLTILLDLDDTLLGNSMDTFLPAYMQALGEYLAPYAPPEKMIPALLDGRARKERAGGDRQAVAARQSLFDEIDRLRKLPGEVFKV